MRASPNVRMLAQESTKTLEYGPIPHFLNPSIGCDA